MQHPKTQDQRPNIRLLTHTHIMAVHDTQSKKDTLSQYTVTLPKHTTTHTHRPTIKTRQKKHQYLKIPDPKTQDLKTKYQTTHTYDGNTRHTIIRDKDTHSEYLMARNTSQFMHRLWGDTEFLRCNNVCFWVHIDFLAIHDTQSNAQTRLESWSNHDQDTLSDYTKHTTKTHNDTYTHRPTIKTRKTKNRDLNIPDFKTQDRWFRHLNTLLQHTTHD